MAVALTPKMRLKDGSLDQAYVGAVGGNDSVSFPSFYISGTVMIIALNKKTIPLLEKSSIQFHPALSKGAN